jgi:hypothetical protein
MKYVLTISFILVLAFIGQNAYSQWKVDSVYMECKDYFANFIFEKYDPIYGNSRSTSHDTDTFKRPYIVGYCQVKGDTLTLAYDSLSMTYDTLSEATSYIQIIFDPTTTNRVNTLFLYDHRYTDYYSNPSSEEFRLDSVQFIEDGNTYSIELIGEKIDEAHFTCSQSYTTRGTHGSTETNTIEYENYIPPTKVSVTFFKTKVQTVPINRQQSFTITHIYPNPASNILTISSADQVQNFEFYDLLGRHLQVPVISEAGAEFSFNTSSLSAGIYWLRAGNEMQKFVIAR